jgi:hypothetical protein
MRRQVALMSRDDTVIKGRIGQVRRGAAALLLLLRGSCGWG